ncbi:MAG TPA: cytochrome c biogenesis protein CcdA [Candidatus Acidoferrales bacterium]
MVDVTFATAFLAGLISFLSPCVLPLVPGYVSLISGLSVEQLQDSEQAKLGPILASSLAFVLGFSVVFVALGASASAVGKFLLLNKPLFYKIAGAIIILFGLHLTGLLKISYLYREKRFQGAPGKMGWLGAFVIGLAFAFGWTPCIGPILGTVLTLAATKEKVSEGINLLAVYSAGLGLPFLLTTLGINGFLRFYRRFRRHLQAVEVFSGILLLAVGLLIFFNRLTWLSNQLAFLNRFVW